MREFLDRYEGSPQVITATRVMQRLLDTGVSYNRASREELTRLQDHGVTARQALEVCGGVWILSYYDPRALIDDDRLTYALAIQLFKTLPRPIRASHTRGGERLHYVPPSGLVRQHVGGAIRGSLGVFFRTVCDRLDTEDRTRKEEAKILATPFTTTTRTALGQKP